MGIEIRQHVPGEDMDDFIQAGREVFRDDPAWIPPLDFELKERLSPKKNPFFTRGEATLFTAWKDDKLVGRTSAQVDREHLRVHQDHAGFFGFFDTINDPEVAALLLQSAERWLKERDMKVMRGPFSLYINEEVGLLVDGFQYPPMVAMAHSRPYQAELAEKSGLKKAKDLYAWRYDIRSPNHRAEKAWEQIKQMPELKFRSVNKKNLEEETRILLEIFNDAWHDNWGFVPANDAEVKKAAADFRLILDTDYAFFVELDGEPVAMCIGIPNLNEAIRDIDGHLFPFGAAKMLWRLKVARPKTARLMMLGIRRKLQRQKKYGALSTAMYAEIIKRAQKRNLDWAELSWTLEDNRLVNLGIKAVGCEIYKTYRVYEKPIG